MSRAVRQQPVYSWKGVLKLFTCIATRTASSKPKGQPISREDASLTWESYGRRNESPACPSAAHRNLQEHPFPTRPHPVGHHRLQQRPGQPVRVPRVLRLCAASHPAVPERPPSVQQLPAKADVLPHVPRAAGLHPQPGHGEGGQLGAVPLQIRLVGLRGDAASHGQGGTRGAVRVPAVLVPLPGRVVQVAGLAGRRHAAPAAPTQVHHHAAGRGHRLPGHGHQPAGRRGLGDDAVVLRLPLHAGAGEAGEVRRAPAVLRHRAADRHAQAGGELCLPVGAERPPASAHLGGHATLDPRGHRHSHHEQRLPGVRHLHRTAVCRERQPGHQRHHIHVLRTPFS